MERQNELDLTGKVVLVTGPPDNGTMVQSPSSP
jgi:hypothetical protein